MNLITMLQEISRLGITVWLEDDNLRVRAPKNVLTTDLREALKEYKPNLIDMLRLNKPHTNEVLPMIVPNPEQISIPFQLTDIQQAYLIGRTDSFDLGNNSTHAYYEIEGQDLNIARLNKSLRKVILQHDMLRAIVNLDGTQQILTEVPEYEIHVQDLRDVQEQEVERAITAFRSEMSHQLLSPDHWPLFDIRASLLSEGRVRLHISLDALIIDAFSMFRFFQDWYTFYEQQEAEVKKPSISFRDYVLTEREIQKSETFQQSKSYWLNRLDNLPAAPVFPLAKRASDIEKPFFKRRSGELSPDTWNKLKEQARKRGLTPTGILLAAYAEILTHYSSEPHFCLNLTIFNRLPLHPEMDKIIGNFTSIILLEVDNRSNDSLENRAEKLQNQLWRDLDNRHYNGIQLLREMGRRQGGGTSSVMPCVFTSTLGLGMLGQDASPLNWFGHEIQSISQTPQVWLDHIVMEKNGTLHYHWDSVEDLFPSGFLDAMFESYNQLVNSMLEDERIWTVKWRDLLPPSQKAQREEINSTDRPVSGLLLHELFINQALERPDVPAILTSERSISYRELLNRAVQIGHWLRSKQVSPNQMVGIMMDKGWEQIVSIYGILISGAAYLPLDSEMPNERLRYLIEHGQVQFMLTQSHLQERLKEVSNIESLSVDLMEVVEMEVPETLQKQEDLAYVLFTSGSTGVPKGVMISHRSVVNLVEDVKVRFGIGSNDRAMAISNYYFDLSVYDIFGLLSVGGSLVIPDHEKRKDPSHWIELMSSYKVTFWNSVPTLVEMLVKHLKNVQCIPQSLRNIFMSGDWIPVHLPNELKKIWPKLNVVSLGGPTETTVWNICNPNTNVDPGARSIPYGKPMTNQKYHVLNRNLDPCPIWVPGGLYAEGAGLAKGYWNDSELTESKFLLHPITRKRLYKTGDIGRYKEDGNIEFLGREDFQVKLNGLRIELSEIEHIMDNHPLIEQSVVIVHRGADEREKLVCYYRERDAEKPSEHWEAVTLKLEQKGLRAVTGSETVLVFEDELEAEHSKSCYERQSYRLYEQIPLDWESVGQLLSACSPISLPNVMFLKYRYPSAFGLYPVQVYLYVKPNDHSIVPAGVYYFHPVNHKLVLVNGEACLQNETFGEKNKKTAESASFYLFLVGKMDAITPLYQEHARDYCMIEAGYMGQLLMSNSVQYKTGLCPMGYMVEPESMRELFKLESDQEFLHFFTGGTILAHQNVKWLGGQSQSSGRLQGYRQYVEEELPSYMVPSYYIKLNEFPLNVNGKIDRICLQKRDLPKLHEETTSSYVAPRDSTERQVHDFLMKLLHHEKIGVHDNFFEIGGDSLLAVQLLTMIRSRFHLDLSLRNILNAPTVAGISSILNTFLNIQSVVLDEDSIEKVEF